LDKLLETTAWRQMSLSIGPSLLFVGSLALLLGLVDVVPKEGENKEWIIGLGFVLALVIVSMVLQELAGRFESKVDGYFYPRMRARCKLWAETESRRRVDPDIYMHHFNVTWERYLDLAPPAEKPVRWSYYSSLLHRYKSIMAFGVSFLLTSSLWLVFGLLALYREDIALTWIPPALVITIGAALLVISLFALLVEIPLSAWLLHWHRVRMIRSSGPTQQCNRSHA
jgi:hypothetical protein